MWVRAGTFPAPVKLSARKIGWYEDEVDAWEESLPRVNYAPDRAAA